MREHEDDVPSNIVDEDARFNTPEGMGVDDPDNSIDATYDELFDSTVGSGGTGFQHRLESENPGITSGTGFAAGENDDMTNPIGDLVEGEEGHPGAGIGFTGAEPDKR